ncbi:YIP1 family protein [Dehalococcoidia bacterium]|nr:YIP1 family protein [Dehalococcoidia bacterium]
MLRLAARAAFFDGSVFTEIVEQPEYMFRALGVVLVAAVAFGLGIRTLIDVAAATDNPIDTNYRMVVAMSTIITSWAIWTVLAWLIGSKLFQGSATYRALLRALGLCYGPMVLWMFVNLPVPVGPLLSMWAHIWTMMVGVLAVQRTQDFAWWKAIMSAAIGWLWGLVIVPYYLVPTFLAQLA